MKRKEKIVLSLITLILGIGCNSNESRNSTTTSENKETTHIHLIVGKWRYKTSEEGMTIKGINEYFPNGDFSSVGEFEFYAAP